MRNGFFLEDKDKKATRTGKRAGLIFSLGLHAVLVYVLYHAKIPIRIFPMGQNVRNVLIVPQKTIFLPGPIENHIPDSPSQDLFGLESGGPAARPSGRRKASTAPEPAPGKAGEPETGPAPDGVLRDNMAISPSSNRSQIGRFELGSPYETEEDGRLRIDLSVIPERIEDAPLGFEKGMGGNRPFRRYIQPGSTVGGSKGGSAPAGGSGGVQKARVFLSSPGYDISPWAQKAIDLIQFNWIIPGIQNITGKSEIRISVDIEKNGTFSRFDILGSTDLEALNRAAVNSLKMSLPLPPLPGDFPAAKLPAVFVFTYND